MTGESEESYRKVRGPVGRICIWREREWSSCGLKPSRRWVVYVITALPTRPQEEAVRMDREGFLFREFLGEGEDIYKPFYCANRRISSLLSLEHMQEAEAS